MKLARLFLASVLALLSQSATGTNLTGTLKYADGTAVNGTLTLGPSQRWTVNATGGCGGPYGVVPPSAASFAIVNGTPPGGASIVGNDCISPTNTYYNARLIDSIGQTVLLEAWRITGATVNLGNILPVVNPTKPPQTLNGDVTGDVTASISSRWLGNPLDTGTMVAPTNLQVPTFDFATKTWKAANPPGTGTVTSVACGAGLTCSPSPIIGSGTVSMPNTGTAGTYTKVTFDAQGRETSGTTLGASDIPALDASKITTGTLACGLLPALTGDATTIAGSCAVSVVRPWLRSGSNIAPATANDSVSISSDALAALTVTSTGGGDAVHAVATDTSHAFYGSVDNGVGITIIGTSNTVELARFGLPTDTLGAVSIKTTDVAKASLEIEAMAGQTAPALEYRDSSNAIRAQLSANGSFLAQPGGGSAAAVAGASVSGAASGSLATSSDIGLLATTTSASAPAASIINSGGGPELRVSGVALDLVVLPGGFQNRGAAGSPITAAATIAPTRAVTHIAGATPVTTISVPSGFTTGTITFICDDGLTSFATGGNIGRAVACDTGLAISFTLDGTSWFPDK